MKSGTTFQLLKPFTKITVLTLMASGCARQAPHVPPTQRTPNTCSSSSLWGGKGEKLDPRGRLGDFSYAGYHAGRDPIPTPPVTANLKTDFHAVGDGRTDDTKALKRAIEETESGVIYIPEGTYLLSSDFKIQKPHLVLRGAGRGKTILFFSRSMTDLYGNEKGRHTNPNTSQWATGPGMIHFKGKDPINNKTLLATLTSPAKRGDRILRVNQSKGLKPGQWVRLVQSDPPQGNPHAGSLLEFLTGNQKKANPRLIKEGADKIVRFLSPITSLQGDQITLQRPLPYDVRPEWSPELHAYNPSVQEVGIEDLTIKMNRKKYGGHFREEGFNGLYMQDAGHCWIRRVEILDADNGVILKNTSFCTVEDVILDGARSGFFGTGNSGHHGITASAGTDNLITGFDLRTLFTHDITVTAYVFGSVFADGKGRDLNLDHHGRAPFSNLFTNIDLGKGSRPFKSGGGDRAPQSGSYSTFWNLRADRRIELPDPDYGANLNFVGVDVNDPQKGASAGWLIEATDPQNLCEPNLWRAMKSQ